MPASAKKSWPQGERHRTSATSRPGDPVVAETEPAGVTDLCERAGRGRRALLWCLAEPETRRARL